MEKKEEIGHKQHSFTKSKNFLAIYSVVTVFVGRETANIYLDLCKTFETILHDILISKLERHGFDRQIKNSLVACTQRVPLNGSVSRWRSVTTDVLLASYWDRLCLTSLSAMWTVKHKKDVDLLE
ncbi:rna-directed dna polymerase from mobile element jockey-like [Pitangus sulphuratus]|nr:rna-directed dna polymerase from mobile element jockey-like [Pitangus sulphuratus]